jgi:GNAT superfamily N-acetyltransferase
MKKALIRAVTSADHDAWLPLWQSYQVFYKATIPADVTELTWQRFLDPTEPMHAAVAELDGRIIGIVHFIEHRSCWTTGNYCYLQDLYTDATVRGRGVGRALIEHVYTQARALGCSRVHWLTQETNTQAMQLYNQVADRSGFLQYRKIFE